MFEKISVALSYSKVSTGSGKELSAGTGAETLKKAGAGGSASVITVTFCDNFICGDFEAGVSRESGEGAERLRVTVVPVEEIAISKLEIDIGYEFKESQRIFVNGYQSWSHCREYFQDERLKGLARLPRPLRERYRLEKYGDYAFHKYSRKKGRFHGYTYGYIRDGANYRLVGSLSEKNGFTIIEYYCRENRISIEKECEGLHIKDAYEAFDLVWTEGSEDFVFDTWFAMMGVGKPAIKPMTGWTSWYNYFQSINEENILQNLSNILAKGSEIDVFQIDDGYQCAVGDWLKVDSAKFPGGMKNIADRIKERGLKSGIWLAPFVCEKNSDLFREKKDWLLRDKKGRPVPSGFNWSGQFALDFSKTEVREYLRKVFSTVLDEWGFDMVKVDFLYSVCLLPERYKTRGGIMAEAMEFIRECAGSRLVLGCGVPLGSCFGLVDFCRVGCDVGLVWEEVFYKKNILREMISTLNTIEDTIGRRHLDGRAFLNDPDVFHLRDGSIGLTASQKLTLFTVNYLFGSLLFTSDDTGGYDEGKWTLFNRAVNRETIGLKRVECGRDGLVEVFYEDSGEKRLALINLGKKKLEYFGGPALVREITFGREESGSVRLSSIGLDPCETRLFLLD